MLFPYPDIDLTWLLLVVVFLGGLGSGFAAGLWLGR